LPRIRTIKHDFFLDDELAEKCTYQTRLFYVGLWIIADDNGVVEHNIKKIKVILFPYDKNLDISKCIIELQNINKIILYQVDGKEYIYIKNLSKHQVIDRPRKTLLPLPPNFNGNQLTSTEIMLGREGKGIGREVYAHFEKFWKAYPRKKSKGQAEKAFIKLNPSEQLLETIISKIEQAKTSKEWQEEGGKFIPYPATWINAKGWEDEYSVDLSTAEKEKPHIASLEKLSDEDRLSPKEREELKGFVKGIGKDGKKKTLKELQSEIKEIEVKVNPSEQELTRKRLLDEQRRALTGE